jgi:hypothetical protein
LSEASAIALVYMAKSVFGIPAMYFETGLISMIGNIHGTIVFSQI